MPGIQLLGWLRQGLPLRPTHERGKGGGRRQRAAAPPASSDAGAEQPAAGEGAPAQGGPPQHGKLVAPLPGAVGVAAILSSARQWGFLWKALALHSANLASSLAARPLQPLHDRLQRQLAATPAVQEACRRLQVEGLSELQDLMNCVVLSEHVYKIVDHPTDASVGMINSMKAAFPPHLVTLKAVLWAQPHVQHRFLLAESDSALYVSFMGTKLPRDMATNANLFQEEVVLDAAMLSSGASAADAIESSGGGSPAAAAGAQGGGTPAAHRGFLARARSVPIHSLYREARARGKRLVLCGHSLGGAVASLCAIQLLQHLPHNLHHTVSCYGFATPALGNEALAAKVAEAGWDRRILNYLSPDDPIPKLLSFRKPAADKAAAAGGDKAAAEQAAAPVAAAAATSEVAASLPAPGSSGGAAAVAEEPVGQLAAAEEAEGATELRLQRLVAGMAADAAAEAGDGLLSRSASAPALLGAAATAPDGISKAGAAPEQPQRGRFARVGMAAATSAAVAAAVLGQDVDVAAATSAAVAAAMLRQEGAAAQVQAGSRGGGAAAEAATAGDKRGRGRWVGRRFAAAAAPPLRFAAQRAGSVAMAAAAPPVRAVVERAGSAARLVALPLSAAASVPMRAAPQYQPLGRQLYITLAAVTAAKPPTAAYDAPSPAAPASAPAAAAPLPSQHRGWPFWGPVAARPGEGGAGGSACLGGSLDVEDNVDVAAAAALGGPAAVAAAAAAAEREEGGGTVGGTTSGNAGTVDGRRKKRGGLFEAHRMATYRQRLLAICQASLEGRLLLRSLPALPALARPGDVVASELLAPAMFPLRAVATLEQPAEAPAAAAAAAPPVAARPAAVAAAAAPPRGRPAPRRGFWQRLLARAVAQARQEPPVELLIRVEGRGLANVTQAWIDGIPPGGPPGGGNGGDAPPRPPAAATAPVTILQQPAAALLPPLERPLLPVFGQLSAFASWLAASLGWVALLRQLQPAGSADFLLARVRLPAAAVREAQRAAQTSLLTSVGDGPLLHGLQLGPRLSLRLQSDFATHSLPLDIRVAAEVTPHPRPAWPWLGGRGAAAPLAEQAPPPPGQQAQAQAARPAGAAWWEWPAGGGTPAGSH